MLDTLTILTFFFSCRPQASDTYLLEFPIILCYSLYCSYTGHQALYSIKYTFFYLHETNFLQGLSAWRGFWGETRGPREGVCDGFR